MDAPAAVLGIRRASARDHAGWNPAPFRLDLLDGRDVLGVLAWRGPGGRGPGSRFGHGPVAAAVAGGAWSPDACGLDHADPLAPTTGHRQWLSRRGRAHRVELSAV